MEQGKNTQVTKDDLEGTTEAILGGMQRMHDELESKMGKRIDKAEEKVERLSDRMDRMSDRLDDNTKAVRSLETRLSRVENHLKLPTPRV